MVDPQPIVGPDLPVYIQAQQASAFLVRVARSYPASLTIAARSVRCLRERDILEAAEKAVLR